MNELYKLESQPLAKVPPNCRACAVGYIEKLVRVILNFHRIQLMRMNQTLKQFSNFPKIRSKTHTYYILSPSSRPQVKN